GAHVSVDEQSLSKFAKWIATRFDKSIKPEAWRDSELWPEDSQGADIVSQFFALGNSINFRYWDLQDGIFTYCEGPKGGKNYRGAFYMWRSLKINCDKTHNSLLSADVLSSIGLDEIRTMFKDDNGRDVMPALGERHRNWQDFGRKLKN